MLDPIQRAAESIRAADALLVTAGAGMGVDSGLPDFRGAEGFWKAYPAYQQLGLNFAQLANPAWFHQDPELAWGFYGHRLHLYRQTNPHPGFAILKKWGDRMPGGVRVFTSNVDGQFQKAGFPHDAVMEAHGSIHHLQCAGSCTELWEADETHVEVDPSTFRAAGKLPRCRTCGEIARPNILMFCDDGWLSQRTSRQDKLLDAWLKNIAGKRLVVVECGAGKAVPTVRLFSEHAAVHDSATLIRINLRDPEVRGRHISLSAGALAALTAIDAQLG